MNEAEIYAELTELVRDVTDSEDVVLGPTTTASEVPGWDSQAHVMLVVAAEQKFGVRFRTAEFDELHNVGDFVDLIKTKLAGR